MVGSGRRLSNFRARPRVTGGVSTRLRWYMHARWFTFRLAKGKITLQVNKITLPGERENAMVTGKSKSHAQIARAATNLGISVAGLVIIRLIVQGLPMFQDMGWIVKDKLTLVAAAAIIVDAMLLSVLIGFAIQLRAYLLARFAEIPSLGTMAVSLVLLICGAIAYADFKPLTRAWPSIKQPYLWSFFAFAAVLLAQITVLLYQNRDRMAAVVLRQPVPSPPSEEPSSIEPSKTALVGR
jgi:hypothetical protein